MLPGPEARLTVEVRPRAGRDAIDGWQGDILRVRVAASPADGAANEAVRSLLAKRLGCARSRVEVIRGHTARTKVVRVVGLDRAAAAARLGQPADSPLTRATDALRLVDVPPLTFSPVSWQRDRLVLLDQRRLPGEEVYLECRAWPEVADAIRTLAVRGAPAIGVAAAFGIALAGLASSARDADALLADIETAIAGLAATRPTAVNLFWALERMRRRAREAPNLPPERLRASLVSEAEAILEEDVASNRRLGALGAELVPARARILTHCNAGGLATAGYGTALGIVRGAVEAGRSWFAREFPTRSSPTSRRPRRWRGARWIWSSWAPTGLPRTGTRPTRSGPTAWPCWRVTTGSHSMSPRPSRRSILGSRTDRPYPSRSGTPARSRSSPAGGSFRRRPLHGTLPST
jgi:uncharacterized protein YggU (UPF0235/DUF167 family)